MRFRGIDYMNEALHNYKNTKKKKNRDILGVSSFTNHSGQKWENLQLECVPCYFHPPSGFSQAHNNPSKSNETRDDTSYQ